VPCRSAGILATMKEAFSPAAARERGPRKADAEGAIKSGPLFREEGSPRYPSCELKSSLVKRKFAPVPLSNYRN
jgi:hypothetical protein